MSRTQVEQELVEIVAASGLTRKQWYRHVYLRSDHWKNLRAKALLHHGDKCSHCSASTGLDVHHLQYKSIYDVEVMDLQILCRTCHNREHSRQREKDPNRKRSFMSVLWDAYHKSKNLTSDNGPIVFWFLLWRYKQTLDLPPQEMGLAKEMLGQLYEWHWK